MLDNIQASAPTISSSAMLVELSISKWTGRKKDRSASDKVEADAYAAAGVANVTKKLLGDNPKLDAANKYAGNVRNLHYRLTMPWSDTGLRLLPTKMYFDYTKAISAAEAQFNKLVEDFIDEYDTAVSNARVQLGTLFHADEYPTVEALRDKFGFRTNYIPLPDAGDFRIDVGHEANEQLREQYASFYQAAFERGMNDIWQRTFDALTNMSERLDDTPDGKKKVFRDTLVSNVEELVGLLDACNVTGDETMSRAKRDLEKVMYGLTPEALREDAGLRAETKRDVDKIIANLPSLDF